MDPLEEVEIKIEYYDESFECDPLKDVTKKEEVIVPKKEAVINDPDFHFKPKVLSNENTQSLCGVLFHDIIEKHEEDKIPDDLWSSRTKSDSDHTLVECNAKYDKFIDSNIQKNESLYASNENNKEDSLNGKIDDNQDKTVDRKFTCKLCNSTYRYLISFRRHMKNKHLQEFELMRINILESRRQSKMKCHLCQKCFSSLMSLKEHVKYSHSVDEIKGNYKHYSSNQNYSENTNSQNSIKTENTKKFECQFCDYSSVRKFCIKRHIKTKHTAEKSNYSCPLCTYTAALKQYMDVHIASKHPDTFLSNKLKIFFCDACGYRTPKKSHYLSHLQIHSQSKNHKCDLCDYATCNKSAIVKHRRTHTNEKPYICKEKNCSYRCISKTALNEHIVKHNPAKYTVFCDKCLYKTVYKQSLRKHLLTHERVS